MRNRHWLGVAGLICLSSTVSAEVKQVPYWASISAARARLRTGPGANFPASWEYVRQGLPLRVLVVRNEWRKVEDQDGTQGWMRAFLLSEQRTAVIVGSMQPLRTAPDAGAPISWQAAPGVVGKIAHCASGWCEFDVNGRAGYVAASALWGVAPDETVE